MKSEDDRGNHVSPFYIICPHFASALPARKRTREKYLKEQNKDIDKLDTSNYTERGLDAVNAAPWLKGLILDGIVAGVGAVLGFVPQMLVLFPSAGVPGGLPPHGGFLP